MDFDILVARFENRLLPIVRKEVAQLQSSGRFTSVEVFSMRHAEAIHAMGIACRPTWASIDLERLGFSVTLMGMDGLSGRIDIQWSQCFVRQTGTGYIKKETEGFHSKLRSEAEIVRFEGQWHRLAELFMRVAIRGRPSMRLLRRLRRAPKDLHGWKEGGANQSPEPTPTTVTGAVGYLSVLPKKAD